MYDYDVFYMYFIGCFYFTLLNIRPHYRSALKAIQLVAIVKTIHIKEYGIDPILKLLVEDLMKLEEVTKLHVF